MDHNVFDYDEDLVKPFRAFLKKIDEGIASEKRRALVNPPKKPLAAQNSNLDSVKIDESRVAYKDPNEAKSKKEDGIVEEDGEDSDSNNASNYGHKLFYFDCILQQIF